MSHKSCLNVLKGVKFIDDATVICCSDTPIDSAQGSVSSEQNNVILNTVNPVVSTPVNSTSGLEELKIKYLEELLRQKDLTILNQTIAINSLQEQVAYLKREIKSQENTAIDNVVTKGTCEGDSYASKAKQGTQTISKNNNKNKDKNKSNNSYNKAPIISSTAVSHSVHLAQTQKVCQDLIYLNKDIQDPSGQATPKDNVRTVHVPRRKSRNILVGDGKQLPDSNLLKSAKVTELKYFHSTYWDPETDEGALSDYLRHFTTEVQVERLNSRNPTRYASFKISVPTAEAHKITKPEIWPNGVLLNQFFRSNNSRAPNKTE